MFSLVRVPDEIQVIELSFRAFNFVIRGLTENSILFILASGHHFRVNVRTSEANKYCH